MSLRNIIATVRDGERVALWDRHGRVEFVTGPRRVWLRGRSAVPLQRHAAAADQYLVIRFKDGHAQHLHGPAAVWFHPVEHESIRVEPAVSLDANEAVVVYSHRPAPPSMPAAEPPLNAATQGTAPSGRRPPGSPAGSCAGRPCSCRRRTSGCTSSLARGRPRRPRPQGPPRAAVHQAAGHPRPDVFRRRGRPHGRRRAARCEADDLLRADRHRARCSTGRTTRSPTSSTP